MLLPRNQQDEVDDINHLLYLLDTTSIIDHLGSEEIATETQKDGKLQKITELINNGKQWIPKTADPCKHLKQQSRGTESFSKVTASSFQHRCKGKQ